MPDAYNIDFAADTRTDWDNDAQPGEVAHALNQLAQRVKDEETNLIEVYDASGGQTVDGTATVITMATQRTNTDTAEFSNSGGTVTITTAGMTQIEAEVTLGTVGSGDYEYAAWLELDGSEIAGTRSYSGKSDGGTVAYTSQSSNYTISATDRVIICDASGGAMTVTLPTASGRSGKLYHIKKIDSSANAVTIDGNGSETIDGTTTKILSMQYDAVMIVADGTSTWHIL